MSATATRPTGTGARFVAYDRKVERIGNPEDGTAISVRAETFVEEYASIRVSEYREKSSNGFDTVYVKFNAASVGDGKMEYDFGASTEPNSRVAARLKHAYENDLPVYVALETCRRRPKDGSISVLAPIHALRGAKPGSASGDPQTTKANCVRVIAAAGSVDDADDTDFASTKDLRSDPAEWEQLRTNRLGDIAPDGWRCLMEAGKPSGGITNHVREVSANTAEIAKAVAEHLTAAGGFAPAAQSAQAVSRTSGPLGVQRSRAVEAKPWEPLNSDNRPNAGSYLAAKIRATHETAVYLFMGALDAAGDHAPQLTEQAEIEHVWGLTDTLLWIADRVQGTVVGVPDRNAGSHKEAALWVAQIVNTRYPYTAECIEHAEARKRWALAVDRAAAAAFKTAYDRMAKYLGVDPGTIIEPDPQRPVQSTRPVAVASRPELTEGAPTAAAPPSNADSDPAPAHAAGFAPADQDPETVRAWQDLAAAVNMSHQIWDLRFVLADTFAVERGMLAEIDATALRTQITQWRQDPARFLDTAKAAYEAAAQRKAG